MESQLAQLQEELNKAKEQLSSSEALKKSAQQENEEAKQQLAAMSAKLEESEQKIMELSASEDARVQELRKVSQDRDRAWESELEAIKNHHSIDFAALASAMNEAQMLKMQLEQVAESEATHASNAESAHAEIQSLRAELTETLSLVENLKNQLNICKDSEAQALEEANKTELQLVMAKSSEDKLRSEGLKSMEAYNSMNMELEKSKNQVLLLEGLVSKLQADMVNNNNNVAVPLGDESAEHEELSLVKTELDQAKCELVQLKSALEAAEKRYQEEYVQSTLQIRSAYELVESTKSEFCRREAELEMNLKAAKSTAEELKSKLMDNERTFHAMSENQGMNSKVIDQSSARESQLKIELKKFEDDLAELKVSLMDRETKLQSITEENETLKLEMDKREFEKKEVNDETLALAEAARAAEREALMKLGYLTEEAEKSSRKAARVAEQLDAAQAAKAEMEAELRRLKVQSDQWRKAAEAAAGMLSTGNNGKIMERTGSFDNYHTIGGKLSSPYSDDMDDFSPKKKNGNMLKKIGVLLKKGQK